MSRHFIGRVAEIAALRSALDAASAGAGRCVLLTGEPGIGKTRLVDEVTGAAREGGAEALWGRCWDGEGVPALWPWMQIIDALADRRLLVSDVSAAPLEAGVIAEILPELRGRFRDLPEAQTVPVEHARFRLFDSMVAVLRSATRAQPLVLVLEDVHWADTASLHLLRFLCRTLGEMRILVIATYREGEIDRRRPISDVLGDLADEPVTLRLALHGLSAAEVGSYVESLTGAPVPAAAATALFTHTGGNPLFVGETVPLLLTDGHLDAARATRGPLALPPVVSDVIRGRLRRLSSAATQLLEAASVIGQEFRVSLLERLSHSSAPRLPTGTALLDALEEAVTAQLIVPQTGTFGCFAFRHALSRAAVYDTLSATQRITLHRRVGGALEALYGAHAHPHVAELAYHYCEGLPAGGDVDKAIAYAASAGDQARMRLAYAEAAAYYQRALAALEFEQPTDAAHTLEIDRQRCVLLLSLGEAQNAAADAEGSLRTFRWAASIARQLLPELGAPTAAPWLARAALGCGGDGNPTGVLDRERIDLMEEALAALPPTDSVLRVQVMARLVLFLYWSTQRERTFELSRQAVEMARRLGDAPALAAALEARHWPLWSTPAPTERLATVNEMLRLADQIGDKGLAAWAHHWRFVDLLDTGDIAQADIALQRETELCDELREPRRRYFPAFAHATRALLDGRFDDAEHLALAALAIGQQAQVADAMLVFAVQMLVLRWGQGRLAEIAPLATTLTGQLSTLPALRAGICLIDLETGRESAARATLARLAADGFSEIADDINRVPALALLADVCASLDAIEPAAVLYPLLEPHAHRNVVFGFGAGCWGPVSRCLGRLASIMGQWDLANEHFEDAVALSARMGSGLWLAQTRTDHAAMLLARGGPAAHAQARDVLQRAQVAAQQLQLTRLLARIAALAAVETTAGALRDTAQQEGRLAPADAADLPRPLFVGRAAEMQTLREALADAIAGRGRVVLVTGEPGIGKTRVAEELSAFGRAHGATVLWGRGWDGGGAPAFWPWIQALRTYVASCAAATLDADLGSGTALIAQLIPEVRERLVQTPEHPPDDSEQARFALFESITAFLVATAQRRPLVLVLDDVHCADAASVRLLEFLARSISLAPILVTCTYRDTELLPEVVTQSLAAVRREPLTSAIALQGLSTAEIGRFIGATVGREPPTSVVATLERRTDGNPLFLAEIVRLFDAGTSPGGRADDTWTVSLPDGVRAAISERLTRLSGSCRRLLGLAAVIGREFGIDVLTPLVAQGGGSGTASLIDRLDEAVAARVLAPLPDADGRYTFTHALVWETLLRAHPAGAAARLHAQIAEGLEEIYGARPHPPLAQLAFHYFEAVIGGGEPAKAVHYAIEAGDDAMRQHAYEAASAHYQRALQAMDLGGAADPARRSDVLLALGASYTRSGDSQGSKETFLEAADLARRLGSADRLARAAIGFVGFVLERQGVDPFRLALLEEAVQALGETDDRLRAMLLGCLAIELYYDPSPARRAALSQQAVEIARRCGDRATLADTLRSRHLAIWGPDAVADRLAIANELCRLANTSGNREWALSGHSWRLIDLLELGEIAGVDADLGVYGRLADEVKQPLPRWRALVFRAMRALLAGDFVAAETQAQEAMQIGQAVNAHYAEQFFSILMFGLRREQGRLAELRPIIEALAEQQGALPAWRCGMALMYSELGEADAARVQLDALAVRDYADLPRDNSWLNSIAVLAQTAAFLDDRIQAARLYDLLHPYTGRLIVIGDAAACNGPTDHYLGLLATVLGSLDDAERHLAAALSMNRQLGAAPWTARTQLATAALLRSRDSADDRAMAETLVGEVLVAAQRLGMPRLAEQAADLSTLRAGVGAESLVDRAPARQREGAPTSEGAVFRKTGDFWTIMYAGTSCQLRDTRGLHYLLTLLQHPDREFHVTELVRLANGNSQPARQLPDREIAEDRRRDLGDAGPVLDAQSAAAYQARLNELREELEEAEGFNDTGRAERARTEMAFLTDELSAAGRGKRAASHAERARLTVTKGIKAALAKLEPAHPALARHLRATVKRGYFCSYTPDPRQPIAWET